MAEQVQQIQPQPTTSQISGHVISFEQHQQEILQLQSGKEHAMYKNRLQEFAQRANLPLPVYHTINEQEPRQSPKFRSTVEVDGETYTSLNSCSTRKAAEQEAAKVALEGISQKIKNCVSEKTADGGFPPIHEDRVFSKSILHEYAMKRNIEKPIYDTVKLESVVPLFVSSLVFEGVKYTGEPSVNKKEAEQLVARAVILSNLANRGVDSLLSEIVKSKAKLISAVHEHYNVNSRVSSECHSLNSGSEAGASAIKEIVSDTQTGDVIRIITSEEPQLQPASKKARIPDGSIESCTVPGDVVSISQQVQSPVVLQNELMMPNLETLPQPSLLSCSQTLSQPTLLLSSQTLSQPTLLLSSQTLSQPNSQILSQPSLLTNSQILSQPNSQTLSQPSLLTNSQTLSQPSLLNSQTLSQPSLLDSQARSQPSLQSQALPSLLPTSDSLPQLPITFVPSLEAQISTNESASSRRRKKKKANKKAKTVMQMQVSNSPLSQAPSCTTAQ